MAGIFGIYHLDGQIIHTKYLQEMGKRLSHRGFSGTLIEFDGPIGLGQLQSVPQKSSSLSASLRSTNQHFRQISITVDSRIDNRQELLRLLGMNHHDPMTDNALMVAAYQKWGCYFPTQLLGDFAFALFDPFCRHLICARDHVGVKSFYYYHDHRLFAFASEIKALFALPGMPHILNEHRIASHILRELPSDDSSFFKKINRLPPAHWLSVGPQRWTIKRYWSLTPRQPLDLHSDDDYASAFGSMLDQAVRCRLSNSSPNGVLLSGGLDSSSVACLAHRALTEKGGGQLHTISAIFPDLPPQDLAKIDERKYLEALICHPAIKAHFILADRINPLADLEHILGLFDEPFWAPNLYMFFAACQIASAHGISNLLTGMGGDAVVSHGIEYLTQLIWHGRFLKLIAECRAIAQKRHLPNVSTILWNFFVRPQIPFGLFQLYQKLRGHPRLPNVAGKWINPTFASRMARNTSKCRKWFSSWTIPSYLQKRTHAIVHNYTFPLQQPFSNYAAAHHVEPCYPFYDRRVLEFCLALPPTQTLYQGYDRVVMRRALEGCLPRLIQWRTTKANLRHNFWRQFLCYGAPLLEEALYKRPETLATFYDLPHLRQAFEYFRRNPRRVSDKHLGALFSALILDRWLHRSGLA